MGAYWKLGVGGKVIRRALKGSLTGQSSGEIHKVFQPHCSGMPDNAYGVINIFGSNSRCGFRN